MSRIQITCEASTFAKISHSSCGHPHRDHWWSGTAQDEQYVVPRNWPSCVSELLDRGHYSSKYPSGETTCLKWDGRLNLRRAHGRPRYHWHKCIRIKYTTILSQFLTSLSIYSYISYSNNLLNIILNDISFDPPPPKSDKSRFSQKNLRCEANRFAGLLKNSAQTTDSAYSLPIIGFKLLYQLIMPHTSLFHQWP